MNLENKEKLIAILSDFETISNKDIQFLMEQAFKAGQKLHERPNEKYVSYESWFNYIKRELLDL